VSILDYPDLRDEFTDAPASRDLLGGIAGRT